MLRGLMLNQRMILIVTIVVLILCLSFGHKSRSELVDFTWFAPFYSGGGYCSEAMSVLFALENVNFKNFSVSHHGDSLRQGYFSGLTETEKNKLQYYDIINKHSRRDAGMDAHVGDIISVEVCHSEPGAWYAPTPKYHTVRCPSDRRHLQYVPGIKKIIPYNIGRTMFETDRIPQGWVERLNYMDEIWVPTEFARDTFLRAGVPEGKLVVVGEAVDTEFYQPKNTLEDLTEEQRSAYLLPTAVSLVPYKTKFLFVGKFENRKGLATLLRSYFTEFSGHSDVILLILTGAYHSSEDLEAELQSLLYREHLDLTYFATPPAYRVLSGIPQTAMPYLYSLASALVTPSHGEGWGRPHMEAMSCGVPVIATNWSGPTAFIRHEDTGYLVSIEPALIPAEGWRGHNWAQPSSAHLSELMRLVYNFPEKVAAVGHRARVEVISHYSLPAMGRRLVQEMERVQATVQRKLHELELNDNAEEL